MPKQKTTGITGDVLAALVEIATPAPPITTDGLEIPDFLKLTQAQRAASWLAFAHAKPSTAVVDEEDGEDAELNELKADVRKGLAPSSVLTDTETRTMYLAVKRGKRAAVTPQEREERTARREAVQTEKKEKRAARQEAREGKVSINQIADELKISGREARGALRAMKMSKPEGGWLFDAAEVKSIKEKVTSWLGKKSQSPSGETTKKSSPVPSAPSGKRSAPLTATTKARATRKPLTKRASSSKKR